MDEELAATEDLEQRLIVIVEKIEATVAVLAFFDGLGDFRERLEAGCWVIDGREELDVAVVGCSGDRGEIGKEGVDRFLQVSELHDPLAVALFHHAVVSKEGDVVGGGLHSKNETVLV